MAIIIIMAIQSRMLKTMGEAGAHQYAGCACSRPCSRAIYRSHCFGAAVSSPVSSVHDNCLQVLIFQKQ